MKRKGRTICVMMAILAGAACPVFAQCREIWIDQETGINDPGTQGTSEDPFKSITYALAVADSLGWPEPWCVYIRPGVYDADPAKPANEREIFPIELGDAMVFEGTDPDTCIIDGQHLTEGHAPLLYGADLTGLQIRGLTFRNMDHSQGNGGAIELRNSSGLLDNCVIENCSAQSGGGMWLSPAGPFDFTSCTFSGNTATANPGGGLYVTAGLAGNITDCTFAGNAVTANSWGGGFGINGSLTGNITACSFDANSAKKQGGGGFYIASNLDGSVNDCSFTNNSAAYGPAGYAIANGGGFFVNGTLTGNVSRCSFIGNNCWTQGDSWSSSSARSYGGGFCVWGAVNGSITDCTFTGNWLHSDHGHTAQSYGGGLYVGTLYGNLDSCGFAGNSVERWGHSSFGGFGAGGYIGTMNGNISECALTENWATDRGGGLYIHGNLNGSVSGAVFGENAAGAGAAFYTSGNFTGGMSTCFFVANQDPGAVFRVGGEVTGDFRECAFVNDDRLLGAGAVQISGIFDGAFDRCSFIGFPSVAVRLTANNGTTASVRSCLFAAPQEPTGTTCWGLRTSQKTVINNTTMIGPGPDEDVFPSALYFDFGTQADNSRVFNNIIMESSKAIHVAPTVDMAIGYNQFHNVDDIVCQGEQCLGNDIVWLELLLDNFRFNDYGDPGFVAWPTGAWTADATYDPDENLTTFYDDNATWEDDEVWAMFVNPDTNQDLRAIITANTATTIKVLGNYAAAGVQGAPYEILDYRFAEGSVCINAGSMYAAELGERDMLDNERVQHCRVDIGAVESPHEPPAPQDCNTNGVEDACDIYDGTSGDCNENHIPDECDIADGTSLDCNETGVPDECVVITLGDFDGNGQVDLDDFVGFAEYMAGPGQPPPASPECLDAVLAAFDYDGDEDIDAADFAAFQAAFTGP